MQLGSGVRAPDAAFLHELRRQVAVSLSAEGEGSVTFLRVEHGRLVLGAPFAEDSLYTVGDLLARLRGPLHLAALEQGR